MRRTILLADDSVTIRKIVELTFGDTEIHVESVASGAEAQERLRDLRPDLVLADVVMPGPSGYDLCRIVKGSDHPVPVLLLAGTFEPFDAEQARECGSDGYLTKPFDSRLLVERVEQLLARPAAKDPVPTADPDLEAMFDDLAVPDSSGLVDAPASTPAAPSDSSSAPTLSPKDIDAIARVVIERLSDRIVREIAWKVVPDLAEVIVRERIRDLERDEGESG